MALASAAAEAAAAEAAATAAADDDDDDADEFAINAPLLVVGMVSSRSTLFVGSVVPEIPSQSSPRACVETAVLILPRASTRFGLPVVYLGN